MLCANFLPLQLAAGWTYFVGEWISKLTKVSIVLSLFVFCVVFFFYFRFTIQFVWFTSGKSRRRGGKCSRRRAECNYVRLVLFSKEKLNFEMLTCPFLLFFFFFFTGPTSHTENQTRPLMLSTPCLAWLASCKPLDVPLT